MNESDEEKSSKESCEEFPACPPIGYDGRNLQDSTLSLSSCQQKKYEGSKEELDELERKIQSAEVLIKTSDEVLKQIELLKKKSSIGSDEVEKNNELNYTPSSSKTLKGVFKQLKKGIKSADASLKKANKLYKKIDEENEEIKLLKIKLSTGSDEVEGNNAQNDTSSLSETQKAKFYPHIQCGVMRGGERCKNLLTFCPTHNKKQKVAAIENRDIKKDTIILETTYKVLEERRYKNTATTEFDPKINCGANTKNGKECKKFLLTCETHARKKIKGQQNRQALLQDFIPDLIDINPALGFDIDSNQSSEVTELHQKQEKETSQLKHDGPVFQQKSQCPIKEQENFDSLKEVQLSVIQLESNRDQEHLERDRDKKQLERDRDKEQLERDKNKEVNPKKKGKRRRKTETNILLDENFQWREHIETVRKKKEEEKAQKKEEEKAQKKEEKAQKKEAAKALQQQQIIKIPKKEAERTQKKEAERSPKKKAKRPQKKETENASQQQQQIIKKQDFGEEKKTAVNTLGNVYDLPHHNEPKEDPYEEENYDTQENEVQLSTVVIQLESNRNKDQLKRDKNKDDFEEEKKTAVNTLVNVYDLPHHKEPKEDQCEDENYYTQENEVQISSVVIQPESNRDKDQLERDENEDDVEEEKKTAVNTLVNVYDLPHHKEPMEGQYEDVKEFENYYTQENEVQISSMVIQPESNRDKDQLERDENEYDVEEEKKTAVNTLVNVYDLPHHKEPMEGQYEDVKEFENYYTQENEVQISSMVIQPESNRDKDQLERDENEYDVEEEKKTAVNTLVNVYDLPHHKEPMEGQYEDVKEFENYDNQKKEVELSIPVIQQESGRDEDQLERDENEDVIPGTQQNLQELNTSIILESVEVIPGTQQNLQELNTSIILESVEVIPGTQQNLQELNPSIILESVEVVPEILYAVLQEFLQVVEVISGTQDTAPPELDPSAVLQKVEDSSGTQDIVRHEIDPPIFLENIAVISGTQDTAPQELDPSAVLQKVEENYDAEEKKVQLSTLVIQLESNGDKEQLERDRDEEENYDAEEKKVNLSTPVIQLESNRDEERLERDRDEEINLPSGSCSHGNLSCLDCIVCQVDIQWGGYLVDDYNYDELLDNQDPNMQHALLQDIYTRNATLTNVAAGDDAVQEKDEIQAQTVQQEMVQDIDEKIVVSKWEDDSFQGGDEMQPQSKDDVAIENLYEEVLGLFIQQRNQEDDVTIENLYGEVSGLFLEHSNQKDNVAIETTDQEVLNFFIPQQSNQEESTPLKKREDGYEYAFVRVSSQSSNQENEYPEAEEESHERDKSNKTKRDEIPRSERKEGIPNDGKEQKERFRKGAYIIFKNAIFKFKKEGNQMFTMQIFKFPTRAELKTKPAVKSLKRLMRQGMRRAFKTWTVSENASDEVGSPPEEVSDTEFNWECKWELNWRDAQLSRLHDDDSEDELMQDEEMQRIRRNLYYLM